jgi:hypothetical protein
VGPAKEGREEEAAMNATEIEGRIRELDRLRSQARLWRVGSTVAIAAIAITCVSLIWGSVQGLLAAGPRQEAFVSDLSGGLQRDVVPRLQDIAGRTLAETRPLVEAEFAKLNGRMPELTQASLKEMETLQNDLPGRAQKVAEATLVPVLRKQEAKVRAAFPEATDENVRALLDNLTAEATERSVAMNDALLGKHLSALNGIVSDMERIRLSEPRVAAADPAEEERRNWEMGLAVFDVVRGDLKEMEPQRTAAAMPSARAARPAAGQDAPGTRLPARITARTIARMTKEAKR